jgi:hypothetical protein
MWCSRFVEAGCRTNTKKQTSIGRRVSSNDKILKGQEDELFHSGSADIVALLPSSLSTDFGVQNPLRSCTKMAPTGRGSSCFHVICIPSFLGPNLPKFIQRTSFLFSKDPSAQSLGWLSSHGPFVKNMLFRRSTAPASKNLSYFTQKLSCSPLEGFVSAGCFIHLELQRIGRCAMLIDNHEEP